ncbi:unnamed protein product, partial [marine sediment metagenome]
IHVGEDGVKLADGNAFTVTCFGSGVEIHPYALPTTSVTL